jgi:hypothetical protein
MIHHQNFFVDNIPSLMLGPTTYECGRAFSSAVVPPGFSGRVFEHHFGVWLCHMGVCPQ